MATKLDVPFSADLALDRQRLATSDPVRHAPCSGTPNADATQQPERIDFVPGEPTVDLDTSEVSQYLSRLLDNPVIDELYERVWLIGKKRSHNIDALHVQLRKGRAVVPAEEARLHLIWSHDRIFVKPVPICLLNWEFWDRYLCSPHKGDSCDPFNSGCGRSSDRSSALGFLRTYALLVRHDLDLKLAQELHLIPKEIDWIAWSLFIKVSRDVGDDVVAKRYRFGQLRLGRLNWLVRLCRPNSAVTWWLYECPYWCIGDYLKVIAVPLLFIFASVTLALSSMQVALSVPPDALWADSSDVLAARSIERTFWRFAMGFIWASVLLWALLVGIPAAVVVWQLQWGFRHRNVKWDAADD
ncbi:Hypothetical protein D9617_51g089010 [Elsinoe fawcettii]|nr:Hypothetical protein D9617_51g089010 [Elsinoe fawcettii]